MRRHEHALSVATDDELQAQARSMRARLRRDGFAIAVVGECFALITEAASRTLDIRHYDVQLMAGWGLLQGKLVEMATGEGKSFAATLPAATVALAGYPVHVITVNDYLAERDAQEMAPLYNALGLTVTRLFSVRSATTAARPMPVRSSTPPTRTSLSTTCATASP